jgi:tellurite resistance protein TehA-like permease
LFALVNLLKLAWVIYRMLRSLLNGILLLTHQFLHPNKIKNKKKSLVTWSFVGRRDEQKHVINFVWPNSKVNTILIGWFTERYMSPID